MKAYVIYLKREGMKEQEVVALKTRELAIEFAKRIGQALHKLGVRNMSVQVTEEEIELVDSKGRVIQ